MSPYRTTSLAAGVLYLLTFVSIPTIALYGPVHDPRYIVGPGPDTGVMIGGILEIVVALACIGTAVVLYPVVKKQNEGIFLRCDKTVPFGAFASLMDALRQAGISNISIVTEPVPDKAKG